MTGWRSSLWMLRPILWLATAYTINQVLHELAHALTAFFLGVPSTLFHFWVDVDPARAGPRERALIAAAGPVFSLAFGLLCGAVSRNHRVPSARLPLLYLSVVGLSMFFGNTLTAAFVGDFSNVAVALGTRMPSRYAATILGAVSLILVMFAAGRRLRGFVPRRLGRLAGMIGVVVLPALVGTTAVILINLPVPTPRSFVMARASEGLVWAIAAAGTLVRRPDSDAAPESLALRWADAAAAAVGFLAVRLAAGGIPLAP